MDMKVNEITKTYIERKLEITGATLLSVEEVKKYLSPEDLEYWSWWWLRSPGYCDPVSAICISPDCVGDDGIHVPDVSDYFNGGGCVGFEMRVRPALKINNLQSSGMSIGDVFELNDRDLNTSYEFKIISENLAWMYKQDIGDHAFNEYRKDNDYETSGIKMFIDWWYDRFLPRAYD